MVPEEKLLEIEIEPGMRDGQEYPFVAEGTRYSLSLCITYLLQQQQYLLFLSVLYVTGIRL